MLIGELNKLCQWFAVNKLPLNLSKTSWGVSRKLATSVNQGDTILIMMNVLKCTQITLLKSYLTTD